MTVINIFISFLLLQEIVCSYDSYKILTLESQKVCSYEPKIRLTNQRISAGTDGVVVKETTYFDNLSGKHPFRCRFEVETGSKSTFSGLFAVIQKMHLREDPETGECIDYVKLRPLEKDILSEISNLNFNLKQSSHPWKQFCGDLSARRDGSLVTPQTSDLSKAGFLSDDKPLEVEIFINTVPTKNQNLSLEIVFTPYTNCKGSQSGYKDCGYSKCIKKQAFGDGVVNCPFLDCPDEDGCDISIIEEGEMPSGLRTKVTLTAVTSIFCSFFLFLGCVWCCRYFELLCWSANHLLGRANPVELSPMQDHPPSAPSTDPSLSKDLPPAYETLFPDRCKQLGHFYMK